MYGGKEELTVNSYTDAAFQTNVCWVFFMPKHVTHDHTRSGNHTAQRKITQEHSCIHLIRLKRRKINRDETLTLDVFRINEGSR